MRGFVPMVLAIATVLVPVSVVYSGLPANFLPLERTIPLSQRVELEALRARDRARHARILKGGVVGGVVDFSVEGTSDPYSVGYGLYFTKVKLGSPPREFKVQIDTGSDILWVACNTCGDCPQSSDLGIELNFFDTASSSTGMLVSCSDPICTSAIQSASTECSSQMNQCRYTFQYGDGSGTSGYYVSDLMFFDMILGQSMLANSSATVVFGCSTYQSGELTKTDKAVDGIFGFGPGALSVISQLSSRGLTPKVFSHCLKGDGNGGGILVLGEILEPTIVYSPLVPSHCFATSNNRGTIVDSGTTLAYLVQEAYAFCQCSSLSIGFIGVPILFVQYQVLSLSDVDKFPFILHSITTAVSQSASPITSKGYQCYLVSSNIGDIFPPVSLNFEGGASMVLKPEQYLMHYGYLDGSAMWCIGFQKVQEGVTILGDLVLKDKIFVYDLAHQRIGWTNYDCSLSVNVSLTTSKDEYINARKRSASSSQMDILTKLLPVSIATLCLYIIVFMEHLLFL
ncbi:aspartic proteinase-like protein 2 isoform X1 [Senna tora]|uniref:Aspartic proteinase-like protein 2 isoform X1 n=1 Tax=Senna tora TaxID=362788 RepID=A0A834SVN4_9FABA|nr:aspartic proteinase-like protein 2 isoform X1 [Senna tora]